MASYEQDQSGRLWWCNSHQRKATHILTYDDGRKAHHCDPSVGGILRPCFCVDLTDQIELVN